MPVFLTSVFTLMRVRTVNNFRVTNLTEFDIDYVLGNLWERGEDELSYLADGKDQVRKALMQFKDKDDLCWAVYTEDKPTVIFGAHPKGDGGYFTWFLSTEDFSRCWKILTRMMIKLIDLCADATGWTYLEVMSASQHPKAGKWFEKMGFIHDSDYNASIKGRQVKRYYRTF